MAEDKVKELTDRVDKVVSDIYDYIKCVDEKVVQNDKTVKFISSQQAEQMKELIAAKTDNLRRFFEEAIRLQTEVVRNTYESMISELKLSYTEDLKNKETEYYKLYNQKEETLKASFEADCQKRLNECYLSAKAEFDKILSATVAKYEAEKKLISDNAFNEKQSLIEKYSNEKDELLKKCEKERQDVADEVYKKTKAECDIELKKAVDEVYEKAQEERQKALDEVSQKTKAECDIEQQKVADEVYQKTKYECDLEQKKVADEVYIKTKSEYEDRIKEVIAWHEKNLQTKMEETQSFYENEMKKRVDAAFENGKLEAQNICEQEMQVQEENYENELSTKEETFAQEKEQMKEFYEKEIQLHSDNAYENGKNEASAHYDEILKNQEEEHQAQIKYYEEEISRRAEEAYNNGKAETEAWHDDVVRQKLEVQAQYFDGEIEAAKKEAYEEGVRQTKKDLYEEMDEAARRNEAELKLFLDFYEAKMKPFKRFINIHETTDKRIKDIQRRVMNKINKTFLNKPTVPPPEDTFPKDIERTIEQARFEEEVNTEDKGEN